MRLALLASSLLVGAATATFACSSSEPAAGGDESDLTGDGGAPAKAEQQPATETPPPIAADAGAIVVDDAAAAPATNLGDAGTLCKGGSIAETEPNDDQPNQIESKTLAFCGRIDPGDVDLVSFTMPKTGSSFGFFPERFTAGFQLEATADGEPFDPNGDWPYKPGKAYVFKLSSPEATEAVDYRLRFLFD